MDIISSGTPQFVSLLAPDTGDLLPLSFIAARQLASFHLTSSDACAALFSTGGARVLSTPNFAEFFGVAVAQTADRHHPASLRDPRALWLEERAKYVQTTALTCQPMRIVEIASGFRVESLFASVQDDRLPDQLVLQTARRVIRCPEEDSAIPALRDNICYASHATWGPLENLSKRQFEVLRLVTKGMGNDQIGAAIRRTKRAVEWHIRGLFAKLRLSDRVQLHVVGMRAGLADIPEPIWREMLDRRFAQQAIDD